MVEYLFARLDDVDAEAATAAAVAAAASAAAASSSETAAASSASDAADSLAAALIAQAASEAAQGLSEDAQAASEAALVSFEAVYLGAYAADPTLDNEGGALVEGQLYWNTAADELRVYDGAAWQSYSPTGGILAVVDDTTPQLGGDLDLNGHTITGLAAVAYSGAYADVSGTPTLGTAAAEDVGYFATAAQGALAASALQAAAIGVSIQAYSAALAAYPDPTANDADALGTGAASWSDLFLASGGVINWNNGDVLATHSANALAFTGASSGYSFDAPVRAADGAVGAPSYSWANDTDSGMWIFSAGIICWSVNGTGTVALSSGSLRPYGNDVAALGTTTYGWSDLHLASGAVVNWANSAATLTHSTSLLTTVGADLTVARASATVGMILRRTSTMSGTLNVAALSFYGGSSTGVDRRYGYLASWTTDTTNGSEDSQFDVGTMIAGTSAVRYRVASGIWVGSPTGSDKGVGTLNAVGVYDDGTLLTCMALASEFRERGEIDLDKWDALTPDLVIPEERHSVPVTEDVEIEELKFKETKHGRVASVVKRIAQRPITVLIPIYDEKGNGIDAIEEPFMTEEVTPSRIVPRIHRTARIFSKMLADGFDPRDPEQYFARLQSDEALPGMPTKLDWKHGDHSTGELANRQWLAMEMLAIVSAAMWAKMKEHDARISLLER